MELVVLGVNHVSAPLPVREALYLNAERMAAFLSAWRKEWSDDQVVGLCTCNRTELYGFSHVPHDSVRSTLVGSLSDATTARTDQFLDHTYFLPAALSGFHPNVHSGQGQISLK